MKGLVVDASTMLAWHFQDETNPPSTLLQRLVEEPVVVPRHFTAELANGVAVAERKRRTEPGHTANLIKLLGLVEAEIDEEGFGQVFERVLPLARAHKLTVYDALYLELAGRRGLILASRDGPLSRAARTAGLEVLVG